MISEKNITIVCYRQHWNWLTNIIQGWFSISFHYSSHSLSSGFVMNDFRCQLASVEKIRQFRSLGWTFIPCGFHRKPQPRWGQWVQWSIWCTESPNVRICCVKIKLCHFGQFYLKNQNFFLGLENLCVFKVVDSSSPHPELHLFDLQPCK